MVNVEPYTPIILNPQTYKQSHTPTVVQGGTRVQSLRGALQDEVYIMGASDVTQDWDHLGRHLGFY